MSQLNTESPVSTNPRRRKKHAQYAALLFATVGFVANVTAIVGLILSHADIIVMTAAVLAALSGLYLLLKRWGKPTGWYTLLAMAIIVTGSVILAITFKAYKDRQAVATDSPTVSEGVGSSGGSPSSDNKPAGKPVNKNSRHTVVFEQAFKLKSQEGLELDDEKGTLRVQQSSAQAPIDLYLSSMATFSVSIKHFFKYQAPAQSTGDSDKDEYTACRNLIDNSQLGSSAITSYGIVPGQQYCILTTQGRVALVTLQELIDGGYDSPNSSVSFTVKLWN